MNIGETKIASLVSIGQSLVVDSEQVQTRCVKVVDMYLVLRDAESEVISRADETNWEMLRSREC